MEKKWYDIFHHIVDFLIPVCLVLLIVVLVIEFFFPAIAEHYNLWLGIADGFIVLVFFLDVVFKYQRASSIPNFLKESWLDIIAIFPFFLFFRVFEGIGVLKAAGEIADLGASGQKVLHTGVEVTKELGALELGVKEIGTIEKEAKVVSSLEKESKIAKEVEVILKEGARSERLARFAKPILRIPRLAEAVTFYEKPGKIEIREKKKVPEKSRPNKLNNKKFTKKKSKKIKQREINPRKDRL